MLIENELNILTPLESISEGGPSYGTQDRQTTSSLVPPQSSQGNTATLFHIYIAHVTVVFHPLAPVLLNAL